jgi:replicative DNA helicase
VTGSNKANEGFERVPPQDMAAEQAILGAMLLSREAIADVTEIVSAGDYYRPAHQIIHNAILDMHDRGEATDPITVADELTRRGDIVRIGGPSYVHGLVDSIPSIANAEHYAVIVRERAQLRAVIRAGNRVAQRGYDLDGDANEIIDAAQAELTAAAGVDDDPQAGLIGEGFEEYVDELEAIQKNGPTKGVPTGFKDLDALTGGFQPGRRR